MRRWKALPLGETSLPGPRNSFVQIHRELEKSSAAASMMDENTRVSKELQSEKNEKVEYKVKVTDRQISFHVAKLKRFLTLMSLRVPSLLLSFF